MRAVLALGHDFASAVEASRARRREGARVLGLVTNHPGHPDQKVHGGGGGNSTAVPAGDEYFARVVDGRVEVGQQGDEGAEPGDAGPVYSAPQARAIADGVDAVSTRVASTELPQVDPAGARPEEYEGPTRIAAENVGAHEVVAFHDVYGDLVGEGEAYIAVGRSGKVEWDSYDAAPSLSDASAFASALRQMADVAEGK